MDGEWLDPFVDDLLDRSQRDSRSFSALPDALPTSYDEASIAAAMSAARAAGLSFRQPRVRCVYAPGRSRGQATHAGAVFTVTLNLAELHTQAELREVFCHELQHIADMQAGTYADMTPAVRERRAIAFANRVVYGAREAPQPVHRQELEEDARPAVSGEPVQHDRLTNAALTREPNVQYNSPDSAATPLEAEIIRKLAGSMQRRRRKAIMGVALCPSFAKADEATVHAIQMYISSALAGAVREIEGASHALLQRSE